MSIDMPAPELSPEASPAPAVPEAPKKQYSGMAYEGRRTWTVPRWMKDAFAVFAVLALITVGASKGMQHWGNAAERAKSMLDADDLDGRLAQPFQLPSRGGGMVDLSQLHGKVVLVNFWATWCPPCRDEEPSLAQLAERFSPDSFEVVAISVDDGWDPVEKFFGIRKPAYRIALDKGANVSLKYGTHKFPESYLVDRDGKLKLKFIGPRNWGDPNVTALLEAMGAKRLRPG